MAFKGFSPKNMAPPRRAAPAPSPASAPAEPAADFSEPHPVPGQSTGSTGLARLPARLERQIEQVCARLGCSSEEIAMVKRDALARPKEIGDWMQELYIERILPAISVPEDALGKALGELPDCYCFEMILAQGSAVISVPKADAPQLASLHGLRLEWVPQEEALFPAFEAPSPPVSATGTAPGETAHG